MDENKGFKSFLCSQAGKAVMIVFFYAIIFGIMLLMVKLLDSTTIPAIVFAVVLGYFGWSALSRIQPNIFLFMPIVGWIIYFVVKGLLALIIGTFVAPFVISKKIVNLIQNNI